MDKIGTDLLNSFLLSQSGESFISDEYYRYLKFAPIFLLAFLISLILTPLVGKLAIKLKALNSTKEESNNKLNRHENDERRINPNRTPVLGGLAVIIPLIIIIFLFIGINTTSAVIIISLTILVIYGVIDDLYNIPGVLQFAIQFFVALIVMMFVADITVIKVPFDGVINLDWLTYKTTILGSEASLVIPGDLIGVFWIMVCMNAVKWINGLDGLMEMNMIIAYSILFIIGIRTGSEAVIIISAWLVGGLAAFTIFNFPPAKIFSGAVGSLSYGFLIATLSIVNQTKFATTIIILMLPLVDFVIVLSKRLFIYRPKSVKQVLLTPVQLMRMADTNHIHHQLLKLNLSNRQILLIETCIALLVGSLAVLSAEAYRFFIVLIGGLVIGLAILLLHILTHKRKIKDLKKTTDEAPESKYSY
jgi:UDP-GlcNAc:undecaprenyl-phosphate GlcNAc-1-phosphate transferase